MVLLRCSAVHHAVEEELALLAHVLEKLGSDEVSGDRPDYDEALMSLRDAIAVAKLEDVAPLVEQMHRVAAIAQQHGRGRTAAVDKNSPYFGHLQLVEGDSRRDVLIGRVSHVDASEGVRIVDWRNAPVSRLFYCYDEGDEYQETFGTRPVVGKVHARRSVTVGDAQLRRVSSATGTFVLKSGGDWQQVESQRAKLQGGQGTALRPQRVQPSQRRLGVGSDGQIREDKRLPEITALIDREQFEMITRPDSGLVVIRGGAGSGKTTVGLHRIAYLGYREPERYRPDHMLVVVYNQALESYIDQVLPSLGFSGVRTVTFAKWASSLRRRHVRGLPKQIAQDTPPGVSRAKKHPRILEVLAEAASRVDGRHHRAIVDGWAEAMTDRELLTRHLVDTDRRPLDARDVEILVEWSVRQLREIDEAATGEGRHSADSKRGKRGRRGTREGREEREGTASLDAEDDALLLRLYQILRGPLRSGSNRPLAYEHLLVDEAQDLSPVELAVLFATASRRASITLAGDSAQRLDLESGFESWEALYEDLGLDPLTLSPLRISYRSTAEIMDLAQAVLGPLADPTVEYEPSRSGAPVELLRFSHDGEVVAVLAEALRELLAREPLASVALVTRFPERADLFYDGLLRSEVPRLHRVSEQDFLFRPGIEITDIRQVKGLEFDYVVLLDVNAASYPSTPASRHLLHIGATRAAHQLWLVCTDTPSPLLPEWLTKQE